MDHLKEVIAGHQFLQNVHFEKICLYLNPPSHLSSFYWGHECSRNLTLANSMHVYNMPLYDCNRR